MQAGSRESDMEKSRSWPSAHDWKSCIPQKGIEGSNPSFSAKNNTHPSGWVLFFVVDIEGFENPMQQSGGLLLAGGLTEQHHNFRQGRKCKRIPPSSLPNHSRNIFQNFYKYLLTILLASSIICKSAIVDTIWRSRVAGRARTIGNRVYPKRVSRVQIPPSPP